MRRLQFGMVIGLLPLLAGHVMLHVTVASATALDYRDASKLYTDAPFSTPEAAGISVLSNLGAVQGNPDGTFQAGRTLNRAEFTKIALLSNPTINVQPSEAADCFPDVGIDDWFSPFVCLAERFEIVGGYPDGKFRPENPVNYAEALKILVELYDYEIGEESEPWYQRYVDAAQEHKVLLPLSIGYDHELTRGQMARLAAAFYAESVDELEMYRRTELGQTPVPASSRARSSKSAAVSSASSETPTSSVRSSASSSSASSANAFFPATTHFLLAGERSKPIADGLLTPTKDSVFRIVKIILEREARSLDKLFLIDEHNEVFGTMRLDVYDDENETWIVEFENGKGSPTLTGGTATRFGIAAQPKDAASGGFSEDWVEVKTFFVILGDKDDPLNSRQFVPTDQHTPAQQTALGRITGVRSVMSGTGALAEGKDRILAAVEVTGEAVGTAPLRVEDFHFHVDKPDDLTVTHWMLRSPGTVDTQACSVDSGDQHSISCTAIEQEMGNLLLNATTDAAGKRTGKRVYELHGDVHFETGLTNPSIQVDLIEPGGLNTAGAVHWTDGGGNFQFVELPSPLATGKKLVP